MDELERDGAGAETGVRYDPREEITRNMVAMATGCSFGLRQWLVVPTSTSL